MIQGPPDPNRPKVKQVHGLYADHDGQRWVKVQPVFRIKIGLDLVIRDLALVNRMLKEGLREQFAAMIPDLVEPYELVLDKVTPQQLGLTVAEPKVEDDGRPN